MNIVVVNKDTSQNLELTISLPQNASSASLITMTQNTPGMAGPSLTATSGVAIQNSAISPDGTSHPSSSYNLSTGGSQITCYVPALSAILIKASS